jgi:predicted Zn-dependent protease
VDDPEILDYINSIGSKLVAASRGATNDNRRDFEFFVLNDDSINAFALPGGFIAVHSGLLLTTSNESELAGVIGHEIAHVLQRHQARGADEQRKAAPLSLLGLVAAVLAARSNSSSSGDTAQAALTASIALSYQNQLNYSRDFEREADRVGLQVMQRAGFDPSGMPSFFERMLRANRHNDGKTPGYLRTHPLTTERIADMQDRVLQMGADGKRNVPDTIEYRLASAKLRVMSLGSSEATRFFRNTIAERTVLRSRAGARARFCRRCKRAGHHTQCGPHPPLDRKSGSGHSGGSASMGSGTGHLPGRHEGLPGAARPALRLPEHLV